MFRNCLLWVREHYQICIFKIYIYKKNYHTVWCWVPTFVFHIQCIKWTDTLTKNLINTTFWIFFWEPCDTLMLIDFNQRCYSTVTPADSDRSATVVKHFTWWPVPSGPCGPRASGSSWPWSQPVTHQWWPSGISLHGEYASLSPLPKNAMIRSLFNP